MTLEREIRLVEPDLDDALRRAGCPVAVAVEDYSRLPPLRSAGALGDDPERAAGLKQLIEGLSAEAREVVELVLNVPGELLEFVAGKERGRELSGADVKAWLRWRGWKHHLIAEVFSEVRKKLAVL